MYDLCVIHGKIMCYSEYQGIADKSVKLICVLQVTQNI